MDARVDAHAQRVALASAQLKAAAGGAGPVALHKSNVYWELSGWAPKYLPEPLKRDIRGRLTEKIMFGSDYPSLPYERLQREWQELGFADAVLERVFHQNAERVLGL